MYYVYERDFLGKAHAWSAEGVARLCAYAQDRARALGLEVSALTGPEEIEAALCSMFETFRVYKNADEARAGIERGEVCDFGKARFETWIERLAGRTRDKKRVMVS